MRRWAVAAAMVFAACVLGATVFSQPVAWAAQAVGATIVGPLDESGNVKVHEAGTANVNVTNGSLSVVQTPVTGGGNFLSVTVGPGQNVGSRTASSLGVGFQGGAVLAELFYQGSEVATVFGAVASSTGGPETVQVALSRPIKFDHISCGGSGSGASSRCLVTWVGAQP